MFSQGYSKIQLTDYFHTSKSLHFKVQISYAPDGVLPV